MLRKQVIKSFFKLKIIKKKGAILCLLVPIIVSYRVDKRLVRILVSLYKLLDYCSRRRLIGMRSIFVCVVYEVSPLHESIGAFDYPLLECLVALLIVSQLFFLFVVADQTFVVFVFFLLPIDCLLIAFFCVSLLEIQFFLQLNVTDVCIHFDHVFPEGFFLVEGLLYLPQTYI